MQNLNGPRIARMRRQRGIPQGVMARALGVSAGALSQWEHGRRPFPREHIPAAASALGVTVDDISIDDSTAGQGRRPQLRPPYPAGATIEHVATLGRHEQEIHERVRAALPADAYRMVSEDFPRDTRHELLVALKFLVRYGKCQLLSPGEHACPIHTMHDLSGAVGDHLVQPAIVWESGGERIVVFGQVWINVCRYGPVRVDFLVYYQRKGQLGYWLYLEIDDPSSHKQRKFRDAVRALALALPGLRYENHTVQNSWFFSKLLADIRGLREEARRRRLETLRRGRRFDRMRRNHAASRRAVG